MTFYFKAFLIAVWFLISCILSIFIFTFRFKNPSNGYIFARMFSKVALKILRVDVKIHNKERLLENQPCIYIGNHQGNVDVLVHGCAYSPRTVVVGKKELIFLPFFGLIFYMAGNIFLNRKNKSTAVSSMEELENYIKNKKISVWVFPEGTRNHGSDKLLPFKRGAFHMAVGTQFPLVPVVASCIDELIDFKKRTIRPGTINIQVLEPIPTTGKTDEQIDELVDIAQTKMQQTFNQLRSEVR